MGLDNIDEIRRYRGLTIEQLSELSGVPISTVKKINAGITANPSLETVRALAKALDCTLDDLESPVWKKENPDTETGDGVDKGELLAIYNRLDPDKQDELLRFARFQETEQKQ